MSLVKRYSKQLIGFAGFNSLLVLWQLAGVLKILPKFVLPTPLEIGNAFVRDRVLLMHHSLSTLQVALIGLVIGCLLYTSFSLIIKRNLAFYLHLWYNSVKRFMMKKFRLSFIHYVLIGFISFAILAIFLRIFGKGYVTLIAIFLVLAGLIALFEDVYKRQNHHRSNNIKN